jgi:hypothetical protein
MTLPEGTVVELRGDREGDWYPVHGAGFEGYIFANFIVPGG